MKHDCLLRTNVLAEPNLSDMIFGDIKDDSRGKKRSPSEVYAVFPQGEVN
jgi:hypothetical protein